MSLRQTKSTDGEAKRPEQSKRETGKSGSHSTTFRLARVLFGGVLAFMAVNNLQDLEKYTQFAESKGAPMAEKTVPLTSGGLLLGGLGIATWKFPRLSAGAIATFFASITPVMHDFWAIDDEEQQEQQMFHFLKNVALFGAALGFLQNGQDGEKRR